MGRKRSNIFTVGHSNHSPNSFLALLAMHGIENLADVRSKPYSRFAFQFNFETLKEFLENQNIAYLFLGSELGGRPIDGNCYDENGRVLYERLAETELFDDGIRRIIVSAENGPTALMCTEKDPLDCHRTLLVARHLSSNGVEVEHILANGELESHETTMDRLLDRFKLPLNGDLFRSRAEVTAEALSRQAQKVAYVERNTPVARDMWEETI